MRYIIYTLTRTFFFFFNDTATTEIYTLSLHDALPISETPTAAIPPTSPTPISTAVRIGRYSAITRSSNTRMDSTTGGSEEHTSELQSRQYLVCRLLL